MSWIADLRFALRTLRRAPGFSAATIAMLALGIGLGVCMYSLLKGVLLERLPYPDSARLVSIATVNPREGAGGGQLTPAEAMDLAAAGERSPFARFAYYNFGGITLFDDEHPREASIAIVGPDYFATLGLAPLYGRAFEADEHASGPFRAVVLSYAEFQRVLGGRPERVGQVIDTSEGRLRVVGVMPPAFEHPAPYIGAWLPRAPYDASQPYYPHARFAYGVGRLRADVAEAEVAPRLEALMAATREAQHLPDRGWRFAVVPLLDELVGPVRGPIWGAFAIALLVLLIACANVAILFDARQVQREHEFGLAHALGASAARIRRTLLMELGVLAASGTALGLGLARFGLEALRALADGSVPRVGDIGLDPGVIAFALGLGASTPLVAVLAGALRRRASLAEALRGGAHGVVPGGARTRAFVPALALALSTVSLVAAAALGLSMFRLAQVEPGFRSANLRALQFWRAGSGEDSARVADELLERLRAVPGVRDVAQTSAAPRSQNGSFNVDLVVKGRPQPEPFRVQLRRVDSGYLRLLGIPVVAGRGISDDDRAEGERVAVINQTLAARTFGGADPVGQVVRLPLGQGPRLEFRVVGVMADIRNDGLRAPPAPELLVAAAQMPWAGMTFLVRTDAPIAGLDKSLAEQVWAIDPRQALARQFGLDEDISVELTGLRFFAWTVGAFALLAQALGAFGIYAVATLQQRRRVREFGLRLAVGARPAALGRTVLREGLVLVLAGASLGVLGAFAVLRLLSSATYGIDGGLHWVMFAGAGAMAASALLALVVPALRAARTDPMVALRLD